MNTANAYQQSFKLIMWYSSRHQ